MAILSVWCLIACLFVLVAGATAELLYDYSGSGDDDRSTLEFADGPSTASITGNVPVFADDSSSLTLSCVATSTAGLKYQWKRRNTIIGYSRTLTLSPVRADDGVTITCTAIHREYNDIWASDSVTLEVHYGPDSAAVAGTSTVYADGINTLKFTCTAVSYNPDVSFQWTKCGTRVGGNSDTLTFTPVPADDGKDVVCIATNTRHQNGQARDNVTLTIYLTHPEEERHSSSIVIGAGVGTSVAVLVLFTVVMLVLWRRGIILNSNLSSLRKQDREPPNIYQNHAFDADNPGGRTNDSEYQQVGPIENPKMFYEDLTNLNDTSERNQEYQPIGVTPIETQYQQLDLNTSSSDNNAPFQEDDEVEYVNTKLN